MKTWKKFGAALCATTLLFALSACGDGGKPASGGDQEDVGALLAAAEAKMAEVDSVECQMLMEMNLSIGDGTQTQEMKTKTDMKMAMFQKPMAMKMDMVMDMDMGALGVQSVDMDMYVMEDNGVYTMYTYDGTQWSSQVIDMSMVEQYDPKSSMSMYINSAASFKADGEGTVQGQAAKKYSGIITNEAMNEVMEASGIAKSMESMVPGGTALDMEALYKDMGDLPISIWLNEEGYPVRYEMDMTEMMDKMYAKLMDQMNAGAEGVTMTCDKVVVSMDCYNYNGVEKFELPPEATA